MTKQSLAVLLFLFILVAGGVTAFLLLRKAPESAPAPHVPAVEPGPKKTVIGTSLQGRAIEAYTYGTGTTHLVFVGGIHGGYEWNSVLLAYRFIDHLTANPEFISEGYTVSVIPSANPDGLFKVVGKEGRFTVSDVAPDAEVQAAGRFNARGVDLNRNFDCKWKPESMWRGKMVSAGTSAFSEPEAAALRDFMQANTPAAVVFWHSKANTVYASECEEGILPATLDIMHAYGQAASYAVEPKFDAYEVTGDAEGWLASIGIPAITVELKTHETVEWEQNLKGIEALLSYFE